MSSVIGMRAGLGADARVAGGCLGVGDGAVEVSARAGVDVSAPAGAAVSAAAAGIGFVVAEVPPHAAIKANATEQLVTTIGDHLMAESYGRWRLFLPCGHTRDARGSAAHSSPTNETYAFGASWSSIGLPSGSSSKI